MISHHNEIFGTNLKDLDEEFYVLTNSWSYYWNNDSYVDISKILSTMYGFYLTDEEVHELNGTSKIMPYKIKFE